MAKAGPRAASALLTIGPFFPAGLAEAECRDLTRNGARGLPIVLGGRVLEAGAQPVRNAVVEIWQPDRDGLFAHPADPRASEADPKFRFWGRCRTDTDGSYQFRTIMPGSRSDNTVGTRLPHINMMVLASGIMRRLVTTLFFADDPQAE
ncbi:MAG TPA: hypothetical protein VFW75_12155, partial [Acetobacteraceae bacterium]|nr:hypothetical protein [Acetobacteraceae bacterium]